uniref:Uncharacterized protein n=1 Tax=Panagrellus redivivus TaxID=6233 RepID=A0A7E4VIC4_PANRE
MGFMLVIPGLSGSSIGFVAFLGYLDVFLFHIRPTLACQSSFGGTCYAGLVSGGNWPAASRMETCADNLFKDWCTVVYKEHIVQAEFHCLNHYNTFPPIPGGKTCGDGPFDIKSGGCARLRAPDGTACLVCCCKGNMCNSPFIFATDLQKYYTNPNVYQFGVDGSASNLNKAMLVKTLFIVFLVLARRIIQ